MLPQLSNGTAHLQTETSKQVQLRTELEKVFKIRKLHAQRNGDQESVHIHEVMVQYLELSVQRSWGRRRKVVLDGLPEQEGHQVTSGFPLAQSAGYITVSFFLEEPP